MSMGMLGKMGVKGETIATSGRGKKRDVPHSISRAQMGKVEKGKHSIT